jgi:hypothetical protein
MIKAKAEATIVPMKMPTRTDGQPGGDYYPQQMYDFIQQNYDYLGRIYYADVWQLKGTPLPWPGIQTPL